MSEHHGFFHHKKDYEESFMKEGVVSEEFGKDYEAEVKNHKHKEHLGELGVVAAGAFTLHEKHKEKKDPDHADKHKLGEVIGAVTVAAGGYALHEHHEKKEAKEKLKEQEGKRHHHLF